MQYFDEFLNDQFYEQLEVPVANDIMLLPLSIEKTRKPIHRLKKNKAPGADVIVTELISAALMQNFLSNY